MVQGAAPSHPVDSAKREPLAKRACAKRRPDLFMELGEDGGDLRHDLLGVQHARRRRLDGRHDLLLELFFGFVFADYLLEGFDELR